jgi:hypothetical protein
MVVTGALVVISRMVQVLPAFNTAIVVAVHTSMVLVILHLVVLLPYLLHVACSYRTGLKVATYITIAVAFAIVEALQPGCCFIIDRHRIYSFPAVYLSDLHNSF